MPNTVALSPAPAASTLAEKLAAKIARIERLRQENAADFRPSFVALLKASA